MNKTVVVPLPLEWLDELQRLAQQQRRDLPHVLAEAQGHYSRLMAQHEWQSPVLKAFVCSLIRYDSLYRDLAKS